MLNVFEYGLFNKSYIKEIPFLKALRNDLLSKNSKLIILNPTYLEEYCNLTVEKINQICSYEILERLYFASATGYLRFYDWIKSIDQGLKNVNPYSVFSSLRGFLESSCDLYYSLFMGKAGFHHNEDSFSLLKTIADYYSMLIDCLNGKYNIQPVSFEQIENALIHFQFADKRPTFIGDIYKAATIKEYISEYDEGIYEEIYYQLCEITHPGMNSLTCYMKKDNEGIYCIYDNCDEVIRDFINKYAQEFNSLFNNCLNILIVSFKLLNKFNIRELTTSSVDGCNCDDIPIWNYIEERTIASNP